MAGAAASFKRRAPSSDWFSDLGLPSLLTIPIETIPRAAIMDVVHDCACAPTGLHLGVPADSTHSLTRLCASFPLHPILATRQCAASPSRLHDSAFETPDVTFSPHRLSFDLSSSIGSELSHSVRPHHRSPHPYRALFIYGGSSTLPSQGTIP